MVAKRIPQITLNIILALHYCFLVLWPYTQQESWSILTIALSIIVHLSLLFSIYCQIAFSKSDPGYIPKLWDFYNHGPTIEYRRYCLICHVFKPERSHHCSKCNNCVLCMDIHQPMLGNCIGFYNKKIFVLWLGYSLLYQLLALLANIQNVAYIIQSKSFLQQNVLFVGIWIIFAVIALKWALYTRSCIERLLNNQSMIEVMDKEPQEQYDLGPSNNFKQVFGKEPAYWLLPIYGKEGMPIGNGVQWPKFVEEKNYEYPFAKKIPRVIPDDEEDPYIKLGPIASIRNEALSQAKLDQK